MADVKQFGGVCGAVQGGSSAGLLLSFVPRDYLQGLMLEASVTEADRHDIRASIAGDERAFGRLLERYEAQVFAQMWRFTRDQRVLDELVQDVFVEVFLSLPKFRGDAPFLHWLRRIATRVGYRHWRQEHRERRRAQLLEQRPWTPPAGIRQLSATEAAEQLFGLLAGLAPKDRLVLTLHYLEECSAKEISERTGWTPTLVRVRLHRAGKRLRRLVTTAGHGRTPHD